MIGIITSILGWLVSNPMMILGAIGIFVVTGWISDAKGWLHTRDQAVAWAQVVDSRDAAAKRNEQLLQEALKGRDNANTEIQTLRASLDEAEASRKVAGVPDCIWSDVDARLLNNAKHRR